jgi:hypothetical protein
MKTIRALALLTLGLLVTYGIMRLIAEQCSGRQCDRFVPVSLFLPLAILVMVCVTGLRAVVAARRQAVGATDPLVKNRQLAWVGPLSALTAIAVVGPVVSLAVFRDNPSLFVPIAALLAGFLPLSVLTYSFVQGRRGEGR